MIDFTVFSVVLRPLNGSKGNFWLKSKTFQINFSLTFTARASRNSVLGSNYGILRHIWIVMFQQPIEMDFQSNTKNSSKHQC